MLIGTDIDKAAELLRNGKLVVFPTETVYGLGANAFDALAVARVFAMKERPNFDPLIVHISSLDQLEKLYQAPIDPQVYVLAKAFWPGPLTMVHTKQAGVPDLITSGLATVAVRMPSHPVALELIQKAGTPVAAPSANKFGCLSPTQASHVVKQNMQPEYLLDGGSTDFGIESTVVSVSAEGVRILRYGAVTEEGLSAHVHIITAKEEDDTNGLHSPGMLKSHYAPRKPMYIVEEASAVELPKGSGLIVGSAGRNVNPSAEKTLPLSSEGDLFEMAVNLFAVLHSLEDDPEISQIYFEAIPETGIGKAIMDRARKAAYSYLDTTNQGEAE
ncbi:MAG TPA: L-threonylcarbamoyladenylate synthase [Prolixibacteraceae bacterium]|nr:L-threonylcarbamoyladenylate synthase [Prolixibacteraceae bacterium]